MNARSPSRALLALAALSLALASCGGLPQSGLRTVDLQVGSAKVKAELALTPSQQETGLMFRKSLEDGRGMLFVFDQDRQPVFWMKNTYVPLSIAYLDSAGTVQDIFDMVPLSLAPVSSSHWIRYALEAPRGFFGRAGLKAGDRIAIPALP